MQLLDTALEQCGPKEQERCWANEDLFLKSCDKAVRAGRVPPGVRLAISCPCVSFSEGDIDLDVTVDDADVRRWGLHYLIDTACTGDPVAAVDDVIQEITEQLTDTTSDERAESSGEVNG